MSDLSKYTVQRSWHVAEVQRLDEHGRGLDLPAAVGAHEPPELVLGGTASPRGLLLKGAERFEVTLSLDDLFKGSN